MELPLEKIRQGCAAISRRSFAACLRLRDGPWNLRLRRDALDAALAPVAGNELARVGEGRDGKVTVVRAAAAPPGARRRGCPSWPTWPLNRKQRQWSPCDWRVRSMAALALGDIGDRRALKALTKRMQTPDDPRVQLAAATAILMILNGPA